MLQQEDQQTSDRMESHHAELDRYEELKGLDLIPVYLQ